jgi:hypothetical protein
MALLRTRVRCAGYSRGSRGLAIDVKFGEL